MDDCLRSPSFRAALLSLPHGGRLRRLLGDLNRWRAAHDLGALYPDGCLFDAALAHCLWMAEHGPVTHGPTGSLLRRVSATGCAAPALGECLAYGFNEAEEALAAWQADQANGRALSWCWRRVGAAVGDGVAGRYWCLLLAGAVWTELRFVECLPPPVYSLGSSNC